MLQRLATIAVLVGFAVAGSGCLIANTIASQTVGSIDQVVSMKLEKDCSMAYLVEGTAYCRDRVVENGRPHVYCYRTLGGVDCYAERDPYNVQSHDRTRPTSPLAVPDRNPPPGKLTAAD